MPTATITRPAPSRPGISTLPTPNPVKAVRLPDRVHAFACGRAQCLSGTVPAPGLLRSVYPMEWNPADRHTVTRCACSGWAHYSACRHAVLLQRVLDAVMGAAARLVEGPVELRHARDFCLSCRMCGGERAHGLFYCPQRPGELAARGNVTLTVCMKCESVEA